MKKKLLICLLMGVVLTGCGAKEPQVKDVIVEENSIVESSIEENSIEEITSEVEATEYPREITFEEMPEVKIDETSMLKVEMLGDEAAFIMQLGNSDSSSLAYMRAEMGADNAECVIFSRGTDYYMFQQTSDNGGTQVLYKLTDTTDANLGDDLGTSDLDLTSETLTVDDVSGITQVSEYEYNVTFDNGSEGTFLFDENLNISMVSTEEQGLDCNFWFMTVDDMNAQIDEYLVFLSNDTPEMTYEDAVEQCAGVLFAGMLGVGDSVGMFEESTDSDLSTDSSVGIGDRIPDETDSVTGLGYTILEDGIFVVDFETDYRCFIDSDGDIMETMYFTFGDVSNTDEMQDEFEEKALELAERIMK